MVDSEPNELLMRARSGRLSPTGSGRVLSRQELADAVNTYVWDHCQIVDRVDATYIGHLEQGRHRWPKMHRREALRQILGAHTDADLGFYINRRRRRPAPDRGPARRAPETHDNGPTALEAADPAWDERQCHQAQPSQRRTEDVLTPDTSGDADLVEFAFVLGQPGISPAQLTVAELACERLDQHFARLHPDAVLTQTRDLGRAVLAHLRQPQTLGHQQRLVTLAARLAGLRAWACFDIDEHRAAERWYQLAVTAAQDAQAWSLGAWLLGAQSLIPWHRRDITHTVELIERGIYFAGRGSDSTTRGWLFALQSRGRAALGDRDGFETAYARAQEAAEFANERDRHHGMDFDQGALDLRYYAGTSRLLMQQPEQAEPALTGSLAALPDTHTKARAVLTLALADAAVQSNDIDQAVDLANNALTATKHQPIMPILQQARRIRRLVQQRHPAASQTLDQPLQEFAHALTKVTTRPGS